MRASFATVGGVHSRFYHHGIGSYGVLMLHGVGVSSDSFIWNLEELGTDRMALAPDLLGYGLTNEGAYRDGPPQDLILDHLVSLIDHLKLSRICVIGSSFGSSIAALLALRVPDRLDRLILVGCGPALNGPTYLHDMYQKSFANGSAAMADPTLDRCRARMKNLVFDIGTVPDALPLMQLTLYGLPETQDRYERRMRGIMSMDALNQFDVTRRLSEIEAPTLVIWGRHDIRGDLIEAEENAARLPNGRMIIYEECGHLPYLEAPIRFNRDVANFISTGR